MPAFCIIIQVHQPYRLKNYPFERIGRDHAWEDSALNITRLNQIADYCYLPANNALMQAIENSDEKFRFAFSISGTCLEQLFRYRPDVIDSFRKLGDTGCVEFLAQTYYHSLAGIYSPAEFRRQVVKHEKAIQHLLEQRPTVLCNTGLLHSDALLPAIEELGYKTIFAEGISSNVNGGNPDQVFHTGNGIQVLARNSRVSDVIEHKIAQIQEEKINPGDAARQGIGELRESASCITISVDYEIVGMPTLNNKNQVLTFLEGFPNQAQRQENLQFMLPSDAWKTAGAEQASFHSPEWTSMIGETKDAAAWCQNHLQKDALKELYDCETVVLKSGRPELIDQWGRLQTSDHFRYMNIPFSGNSTQNTINPYHSAYDAYLNYMNVLSDFRKLLEKG